MGGWKAGSTIIRTFGIANILLGILGILLLLSSLSQKLLVPQLGLSTPYYAEVYLARGAINALCVSMLIYAGIGLYRLERTALAISNGLFAFEIFYLYVDSIMGFLLEVRGGRRALFAHALDATWGTGNMGVGPQLIPVYPLLALIALNLAYRKLGPANT